MWLAEAGLYHYKARAYHPALGRFMQTDPAGYGDGMNLYAYAGNDPVNFRDPTGLYRTTPCNNFDCTVVWESDFSAGGRDARASGGASAMTSTNFPPSARSGAGRW